MPVLLKELKRELQDDKEKVGKDANGQYKHTPPNIVGRTVKGYTKLNVSKPTSKASVDLGWLTHTGLVASETTGIKYKVSVNFNDMEFSKVKTKQFKEKSATGRKVLVWHRTPNANVNSVRLRCSCQDFQHRFMHPLAIFDALVGLPISYTRITNKWPKGRPEVNVTDKIGFCKHVASFLQYLKDNKKVNEIPVIL